MTTDLFTRKEHDGGDDPGGAICFPHHDNGEYDSLEAAVVSLSTQPYNALYLCLRTIIEYNIRYRDYLRSHGHQALIEQLLVEAPTLKEWPDVVKRQTVCSTVLPCCHQRKTTNNYTITLIKTQKT